MRAMIGETSMPRGERPESGEPPVQARAAGRGVEGNNKGLFGRRCSADLWPARAIVSVLRRPE